MKGITTVSKKLGISSIDGKGYRALANISDYGGQEVPHLHFHFLEISEKKFQKKFQKI